MPEENETTVVDAPAAAVEPTTTPAEKTVTSPEVKVEVPAETPVQNNDVDYAKTQAQIDNLNIALKQERETRKEQETKLSQSQETIDKLKTVFSPTQPEETPAEALSMSQIEELLDRRDSDRAEKTQKETQAEAMKTEITKLESEWSGVEGKPKYEDKEVLNWQEKNQKLHLSPSEAFNEMSRDSIIDWEIKNRMANKPQVQNVETPGGTVAERAPQETTPNTEDLRSAVLEAMDIADSDTNN